MNPSLKILFAVISGVAFALAFPDVAAGWLAFIALAPLLIAITTTERTRHAFLLGWLAHTIAWLIMVPWVIRVMSHYGGLPYAAGVAIFGAMAAYLGLYGGLFAIIVHRIRPRKDFGRWLLIPLAWAAVEYVRTYLLSGFPWSLIATTIVDYTSLIQIDRFAGPYLVGAMILLPSTVIAWIATQKPRGFPLVLVIGVHTALALVWWGTGLVTAKLVARPTGARPAVAALLQPNISQEMRWDESSMLTIFRRMMAMTEEAIANGASVVIWPESTVPLSYNRTEFYRDAIESISLRHNVDIILGSVAEDSENGMRLWNAAFLVSNGRTIGHYDKIKLVPFGEFVPMRKMLFFAQKLVHEVGEFSFGTNDRPLAGRFRYGPAICYEIVFPQITRTQIRNGANVLVTITNDAWYDGTSAPRQHLNQARLRAVEGDRYLLRAGTTGISAFIDPSGRIRESIPMGRAGIIYARFQEKSTVTPYVRFGDWFAWVAMVAVGVGWWRGRGRG
ncbi:MAG: apolipoprotein N-acyltransferase [Thermoanaerobaculia bacterium]|nr:apolipoprotein N-acyltransferase [Thermoanaerobaculia bacterium]